MRIIFSTAQKYLSIFIEVTSISSFFDACNDQKDVIISDLTMFAEAANGCKEYGESIL